jgi:hypothetical protein
LSLPTTAATEAMYLMARHPFDAPANFDISGFQRKKLAEKLE